MKSFIYGVITLLLVACAAPARNQPHMENALQALRAARSELQQAAANKGGHRERAIGLTDAAIREVEAGMAYADGH
jgi:hypothetical protein